MKEKTPRGMLQSPTFILAHWPTVGHHLLRKLYTEWTFAFGKIHTYDNGDRKNGHEGVMWRICVLYPRGYKFAQDLSGEKRIRWPKLKWTRLVNMRRENVPSETAKYLPTLQMPIRAVLERVIFLPWGWVMVPCNKEKDGFSAKLHWKGSWRQSLLPVKTNTNMYFYE